MKIFNIKLTSNTQRHKREKFVQCIIYSVMTCRGRVIVVSTESTDEELRAEESGTRWSSSGTVQIIFTIKIFLAIQALYECIYVFCS